MNKIFATLFGSRLYGLEGMSSDLDIRGVYIPSTHDLFLDKAKPEIAIEGADEIYYSLPRFTRSVLDGEVHAVEMLFAPSWAQTMEASADWSGIRDVLIDCVGRPYLERSLDVVNSRIFVHFIAHHRIEAIKSVLLNFSNEATNNKIRVENVADSVIGHLLDRGISSSDISIHDGYLVIFGKSYYLHSPAESLFLSFRSMLQKLELASRPETERKAYKIISQGIRILGQAIEFAEKKSITFPRPDVDLLRRIKFENMPMGEISDICNDLSERLKVSIENSDPAIDVSAVEKAENVVYDAMFSNLISDFKEKSHVTNSNNGY